MSTRPALHRSWYATALKKRSMSMSGNTSSRGGASKRRGLSRPSVANLAKTAAANRNYRTVVWTGRSLQLTNMSIGVRSDIGIERHDHTDQIIRVERGKALVQMGSNRHRLHSSTVRSGHAIFVPAGTWHNVTNIGKTPLKLTSIYSPPNHKPGLVQPHKPAQEDEY